MRARTVIEGFPQALEMVIQALQAGQTLPQALAVLSKEGPPVIREEFAAVRLEIELGMAPDEALHRFAQRVPHPDLEQFADSYRLSRLAGANLIHLYRVQWDGIEERHRIMRRLDSMTAQARFSGLLMGSLPVFLLAALAALDGEMVMPLFDRPVGWAVLAFAIVLESLGFLWIRKLMRLEI